MALILFPQLSVPSTNRVTPSALEPNVDHYRMQAARLCQSDWCSPMLTVCEALTVHEAQNGYEVKYILLSVHNYTQTGEV